MISIKQLITKLETASKTYGEGCEVDTFSGTLDVYDEKGEYVEQLEV